MFEIKWFINNINRSSHNGAFIQPYGSFSIYFDHFIFKFLLFRFISYVSYKWVSTYYLINPKLIKSTAL